MTAPEDAIEKMKRHRTCQILLKRLKTQKES
jgi:hypothetical protein